MKSETKNIIGIVISWVVVIFIVVFLFLFLIDCTTYKLERNLKPDIKAWYEYHRILMFEKVPKWVDANNRTEREHFLQLPEYMQRKYIKIFWKIRVEGLKDSFYQRMAYANRYFNEGKPGWKTDRGQVLILCGFPNFVRYIRDIDLVDPYSTGIQNNRNAMTSDIQGRVYLIWSYSYRNFLIQYRFEYQQGETWRRSFAQIGYTYQRDFEKRMREVHAPNNWDIWVSILLDWVHKTKKNPTNLQGKIQ